MVPPKPSVRTSDYSVNPLLLLGMAWFIPGSGFLLLGPKYRQRAIFYIVLLHLTFILGIVLRGGVIWPIWSLSQPGFSIMNNLTFLAQMGAGWPWLFSLLSNSLHWSFGAAMEYHPFFELGSFYCLVSGALNYFAMTQTLDRARKKAFERLARQ